MSERLNYKGEAKDIVSTLHYSIRATKYIIGFTESKLYDFVNESRANSNVIIDNRAIIELGKKERMDLLDYMFFDADTIQQYNYNLLCVHIYSSLEQFLKNMCSLLKCNKHNYEELKGRSFLEVYTNILKNNYPNLDIGKIYNKLDNWRLIRNSIVHNKNILTKNNARKVSSIVDIDWSLEPYEISFIIKANHIVGYLDLIKDFSVLICKTIFKDFDDSIKIE